MRKYLVLITGLFLLSLRAFSQDEGIPLIRNYTPEEYNGFSQNWCAEQDVRGVMYFGNGKGILEYNGVTWRRFFTEKKTTVLSMCRDTKGRIYVGGENEIGYLAPDSAGKVIFRSLMHLIPEKEMNFGYVWQAYSNSSGVYFITPEKVIKITKDSAVFYKPHTSFFTSFMVGGQFYIQDQVNGLFKEKDGSLIQPPGGKNFGDIRAILPNRDKLLFVTRQRGLFQSDGSNPPVKMITDAEFQLKEHQLYKGVALPDSSYAFATLSGGIIIIRNDGSVKNIINEKYGLLSNLVYYLFVDEHGDLWACLGNGLSRIETSSPFTYFDKHHGLKDVIQDLLFVNNELYISALNGLFRVKNSFSDLKGFRHTTIEKFDNFKNQIFTSSVFSKGILFAGSGGVHFYDYKDFRLTFHFSNEICVKTSRFYKDLYFVGGSGFVYAVINKDNRWIPKKIYDNGIEDFYFITEKEKGAIWTSTVNHGIIKFTFIDTVNFNARKEVYDTTKGVPAGMTEVYLAGEDLLAGTLKGIYRYSPEDNLFKPALDFPSELSCGSNSVYLLSSASDGRIWSMYNKTINVSELKEGKYVMYGKPFRRLKFTDMYKILPCRSGVTFFGGTDGLVRYDENVNFDYNRRFHTVFTKITALKDTVFNGAYYDSSGYVTTEQPQGIKSVFGYRGNSFVFEFAAPYFHGEEMNMFRWFLEGFDEEWSDWVSENKKEYTNLPEGSYTFRVKSRNTYHTESYEAVYSFEVLPPWHRTIWAYVIFAVFIIIFVYLIVVLNTHRLRRANIRLEKIVAQRTEELRNRNAEILQQKEEIETQRDEIEAQRDNLIVLNHEILQQKEEIEAQRDEIQVQRDTITFQNKEMLDSIRYARLIQSALMHPPAMLDSVLPGNFIFFRPKDIVSGDFYWFAEINNKVYIAAVDCTGHGVPGGFMSMLGMTFLNEIATSIKHSLNDYTAARILFLLRRMVISSLNQQSIGGDKNSSALESLVKNLSSTVTVKDGMDISLCIIDTSAGTINFAGANNPLYLVCDSHDINPHDYSFIRSAAGSEKKNSEIHIVTNSFSEAGLTLTEIKGDKMPIGAYYDNEKPFTNHEIRLKNCTAYIFSDGFADQFGGNDGKKFKYRKLKELFVSIYNDPLPLQSEKTAQVFDEWKNGFQQVDDVLVIGMKI